MRGEKNQQDLVVEWTHNEEDASHTCPVGGQNSHSLRQEDRRKGGGAESR